MDDLKDTLERLLKELRTNTESRTDSPASRRRFKNVAIFSKIRDLFSAQQRTIEAFEKDLFVQNFPTHLSKEDYEEICNWGCLLHTSLRKCCDSTITCAAHYLLNMNTTDNFWSCFLEYLWTRRIMLAKGSPSVQEFASRVKKISSDDWSLLHFTKTYLKKRFTQFEVEEKQHMITQSLSTFCCILELFSDKDWKDFVYFLWQDLTSIDKIEDIKYD